MCSIRGEGEQIMPPWIIFHGAGYISQGEADYYDALGIGWHFQAMLMLLTAASGCGPLLPR